MKMTYYPEGVCTSQIEFDIVDNRIHDVRFTGGCEGNLKGIAALVENMNVESVISALKGISCDASSKACPAQFADALECYKEGKLDKLRALSSQEILNKQQRKSPLKNGNKSPRSSKSLFKKVTISNSFKSNGF